MAQDKVCAGCTTKTNWFPAVNKQRRCLLSDIIDKVHLIGLDFTHGSSRFMRVKNLKE